jgi:hypothetical protein
MDVTFFLGSAQYYRYRILARSWFVNKRLRFETVGPVEKTRLFADALSPEPSYSAIWPDSRSPDRPSGRAAPERGSR